MFWTKKNRSARARKASATRQLSFQKLEDRRVLAHGCPQLDINDDGWLAPQDALIWANNWNEEGGARVSDPVNHPFDLAADINGDGRVTTTDWFFLVHGLNEDPGVGPYDLGWCEARLQVAEGEPQPSRYLLGGVVEASVLEINFQAKGKTAEVTVLVFSIEGEGRSVDRLQIHDGAAVLGHATRAAAADLGLAEGHFAVVWDSHQVEIGAGSSRTLHVHPRMISDELGGVSGDTFVVKLVRVDAQEAQSGEAIVPAVAGQISSEPQTSVHAKITEVKNASPDSDGTAVPTGVSRTIGEFAYIAASHGNTLNGLNDVVLGLDPFTIESANVLLDRESFELYNKADQTQRIPCTADNSSGDIHVTCKQTANPNVNLEVDRGEKVILVLAVDILNNKVQSSDESRLRVFAEIGETGWEDRDLGSSSSFTGLRLSESRVGSTLYRS